MRIAHAAGTLLVHTHHELFVSRGQLCRIPLQSPRSAEPQAAAPSFTRDHLALDPSGAHAIVTRQIGQPALDGYDRPIVHWSSDLCRVDLVTRVARSEGRADAATFVGPDATLSVRARRSDVSREIYLDGAARPGVWVALPEATRVAWPTGKASIWKKAPWREGGLSSSTRLASNRFGHVAVDPLSGVLVRFDLNRPASCAALRVPTEPPETDLLAFPTSHGLLVAYSGGRDDGALVCFSSKGEHLGGMRVNGNVSDVAVLEDSALLLREKDDLSGKLELIRVSLPGLVVIEAHDTSLTTYDGFPGLATDDDASTVWVGNGARVEELVRRAGRWKARPLDLDAAPIAELRRPDEPVERPAPTPAKPAGPRRVVHAKFGEGVVVGQEGSGAEAKLEIAFASGRKKLQARFVTEVD